MHYSQSNIGIWYNRVSGEQSGIVYMKQSFVHVQSPHQQEELEKAIAFSNGHILWTDENGIKTFFSDASNFYLTLNAISLPGGEKANIVT